MNKNAADMHSSPKKLCSSCGLCMVTAWPAKESLESCVFTNGWLGKQESSLFGRERSADNDEIRFGISKERFAGCIRKPIPGAAWTGVITRIAQKAFETGMVEAVVTLHRGTADHFESVPVLARSTAEILAGCGNKPIVSPVLHSLQAAYEQGIKRLLVIGAPCHVHALRDFSLRFPYLKDMNIFIVGIPCVSNVTLKNLRLVLEKLSVSPKTVRHYEFMQDYSVHLRHEDGHIERVPFFSLPREITGINYVVPACMCCFDYVNSLTDITVGYMGAPFNMKKMYQWIIIRTDKGKELYSLIADDLETVPESKGGDCTKAVIRAATQLADQIKLGSKAERKTGRKMPIWSGNIFAGILTRVGPRGTEFARYGIDMHLIRNYYYVKTNYPDLLQTLVPKHVYPVLKHYGFTP
jgi:coenzyme F420 hydrogenase subunit beta